MLRVRSTRPRDAPVASLRGGARRPKSEGMDERMLWLSVLSVARAPCESSSRLFGDDPPEPQATLMVNSIERRPSPPHPVDLPER
jgi:hypothetical protein